MDKGTLAHTSWNCKYHIVFPQSAGKALGLRLRIGTLL